jgi:hypothetical protein
MKIIRIMLSIFALTMLPAAAQIDKFHGGPVSASGFSSRYAIVSGNPANLRWVPDPAGSGRKVAELQVRNTDAKLMGGLRTEITLNNDYIREGVRWYALSVYFPEQWRIHPYPTVVAQLHTSQKTAILSPPVSFVVRGANIDLELNANFRPIDGPDPATKANSAHQSIRLDTLKTERWYCFLVRADWSTKPGEGALRIWMNGDNVYEAKNLYNSYETWLGNYARVGIYMPGMISVDNRLLYADFIHVGGPKTSFEEMAALTPCGNTSATAVPQ